MKEKEQWANMKCIPAAGQTKGGILTVAGKRLSRALGHLGQGQRPLPVALRAGLGPVSWGPICCALSCAFTNNALQHSS